MEDGADPCRDMVWTGGGMDLLTDLVDVEAAHNFFESELLVCTAVCPPELERPDVNCKEIQHIIIFIGITRFTCQRARVFPKGYLNFFFKVKSWDMIELITTTNEYMF